METIKEAFIALIGIYFVGNCIETLFGITGAALILFIAVGGIPYIAEFFQ